MRASWRGFSRIAGVLGAAVLISVVALWTTNRLEAQEKDGQSAALIVFAAASLTEPFKELATAFEKDGAGSVIFNFGGSNELRTQLENGATADVLATAATVDMDKAQRAALIAGRPSIFAHNRLVVLVPASMPQKVTTLKDLAAPGVKLVVAHPNVPVGRYSQEMFAKMGLSAQYGGPFREKVLANVVSLETNVKQVVAKVVLGEADAGIAYVSDITRSVASKVRAIDVPDAFNVDATYPIAVLARAAQPTRARRFVEFVLSPVGQSILARSNFVTRAH